VTTHADLGLDLDVCDTDAVADRRDELVAAVRDHAGTIAYQLAKLQGGDYGRQELSTPGGHGPSNTRLASWSSSCSRRSRARTCT